MASRESDPTPMEGLLLRLRGLPADDPQRLLSAYTEALPRLGDDTTSLLIFLDYVELSRTMPSFDAEEISYVFWFMKSKFRGHAGYWRSYIQFEVSERRKKREDVLGKVCDWLRVKEFPRKGKLLVELGLEDKTPRTVEKQPSPVHRPTVPDREDIPPGRTPPKPTAHALAIDSQVLSDLNSKMTASTASPMRRSPTHTPPKAHAPLPRADGEKENSQNVSAKRPIRAAPTGQSNNSSVDNTDERLKSSSELSLSYITKRIKDMDSQTETIEATETVPSRDSQPDQHEGVSVPKTPPDPTRSPTGRPQAGPSDYALPVFEATGTVPPMRQPQEHRNTHADSSPLAIPAMDETQPIRTQPERIHFRNTELFRVSRIGKGGYSVVYRVLCGEEVYALKEIRAEDEESRAKCLEEVEILKRLGSCDFVVRLIEYEVKRETVSLLLEYGEVDLQRLINSGPLDPHYIRYLWSSILRILHFIHQNRIIHRDIKPANFVLVKGALKLIDFGISKSIRPDTTSVMNIEKVGTLNYISPEQCVGGKVSRATDVWSAGCILYFMIYSRHIFQAKNIMDVIRFMAEEKDIEYSPADERAIETIKACLRYDPKSRAKPVELLRYSFLGG